MFPEDDASFEQLPCIPCNRYKRYKLWKMFHPCSHYEMICTSLKIRHSARSCLRLMKSNFTWIWQNVIRHFKLWSIPFGVTFGIMSRSTDICAVNLNLVWFILTIYKRKGFFHVKSLCLSGNEEQLILYVNVNKEMNRTEDQWLSNKGNTVTMYMYILFNMHYRFPLSFIGLDLTLS